MTAWLVLLSPVIVIVSSRLAARPRRERTKSVESALPRRGECLTVTNLRLYLHGMDRGPPSLDRAGDPDGAGNRTGHRYHHFHLHPGRTPAAGAARSRAAPRTRACHGHAHPAASVAGLGDGPGRSAIQPRRLRYFGS